MTVTAHGSPVPDGWEPQLAKTITMSPADRTRLVTLLNDAPRQPTATGSSVDIGYEFTVTLRTADGRSYKMTHRLYPGLNGTTLKLSDRRSMVLNPGTPLVALLKALGGVSTG